MKRWRRGELLLATLWSVSLIVAMVLLYDFYRFPAETKTQQETEYRLVFLSPNKDENYWCGIAEGVKAADQELGTNTLLVQFNGNENVPSYFYDAVQSGVDGIIMKGSELVNDQIEEHRDIPVVFYDSDFVNSERDCYVGTNNYVMGTEAAKQLVQGLEGTGNVLVITRNCKAYSQTDKIAALEDYLKDYPDVVITDYLEDGGNELELKEQLVSVLEDGSIPDAVLCMEEIASNNLPLLFESVGLSVEDCLVITLDFTDDTLAYIKNGTYDMLLSQDPYTIGYQAVQSIYDHLEQQTDGDQEEMPQYIYTEAVFLNKDNIEEYTGNYDKENLEWNAY